MIPEQMDPAIKGGDGDLPLITEFCYSAETFQVSMQDDQDKAKGVGTKRNQDIRKHSMGMSTGSAEEPGDRNGNLCPFSGTVGDQVPLIRSDLREISDGPAFRTRAGRKLESSNRPVKELLVGKMKKF